MDTSIPGIYSFCVWLDNSSTLSCWLPTMIVNFFTKLRFYFYLLRQTGSRMVQTGHRTGVSKYWLLVKPVV